MEQQKKKKLTVSSTHTRVSYVYAIRENINAQTINTMLQHKKWLPQIKGELYIHYIKTKMNMYKYRERIDYL